MILVAIINNIGYYKDKNMKNQASKTKSNIKSLATQILQDDETNEKDSITSNTKTIENDNLIENQDKSLSSTTKKKRIYKSKRKIPYDEEKTPSTTNGINFDVGTTKTTAFVVQRRIEEIYSFLNQYLGNQNDYFIGSENTLTSTINGQRKRFKCIIVEDKNHFTYTLWFDISFLGPVY